MRRWKVSSAPDATTLGGLISYAFSIICFRKQIYWMSYLQFHFLPSFCFPFLLTVLPSLLSFPCLFISSSFFDFRQWQLEIDPEFSVFFCHMFHWGSVIGETDCMKEITPILFFFLCNSRDYNPHLSSHFYIIIWGEEQCVCLFFFFFLLLRSNSGNKKIKSFLLVMHLPFLIGLLRVAI